MPLAMRLPAMPGSRAFLLALAAALTFALAVPAGKFMLAAAGPFTLAGLYYLGAAGGVLRPRELRRHALWRNDRRNLALLVGAIVAGGLVAPVLLLAGLARAPAGDVALWLNLELVATVILGRLFFQDGLGRFGWFGTFAILAASVALSWTGLDFDWVPIGLVASAAIAWGLDNHLTALIDGFPPTTVTFWKGLVAGATNLTIGLLLEPGIAVPLVGLALLVGAVAYGWSIVLYIVAAHEAGAVRAQLVFSSHPFLALALSAILLGERLSWPQFAAGGLMVIGVVLVQRERHEHAHVHEPATHTHSHRHDDGHHTHVHPGLPRWTRHVHRHHHERLEHSHPHRPDLHHRHRHD